MRARRVNGCLLVLVCLIALRAAAAEPLRFRVRLDESVANQPITGRLYVFLSHRSAQPRFGPNWFQPEPFFGQDVAGFEPGKSHEIDDKADGFPAPLSRLRPGEYRVQAVLHHSFDVPQPGQAPGNFYSATATASLDPAASGAVDLVLDRVVEKATFPQSPSLEEFTLQSPLLSEYHGRDVVEPAAVVLPASYPREPDRRYPVVYVIPGFGGSHRDLARAYMNGPPPPGPGEGEFIRVLLSGQCRWGHHVFANSATNGPRGDALVREMVPAIDRKYRTVAATTARFVTGHSSGGWAALWLQVNYPDVFGGVWSLAPDPVDFRNFQEVDLYADPPLSLFRDPRGALRPIARRGPQPVLWYEPFVRMDDTLKYGGQIRSFEAVFSPLGPDRQPRKICDRATGRIDPEVAAAWQQYDINLLLKRNWPTLGPKLQGKLHITAAGMDTFYLEGAVKLLAATLRELGSDAQIQIVPGADHSSLLTPELNRRNRLEMSQAFLKSKHGDSQSQLP
ncbi:MAG: hypothetical protein HUU20_07150 [Pirellulales bacterium]|nr:hypothetical protein [Pirellulales bacterium]